MMSGFASFNAATKIINLARSEMADAKLAALAEELIHFQQAQTADVSPLLEAEVDKVMAAMGFVE